MNRIIRVCHPTARRIHAHSRKGGKATAGGRHPPSLLEEGRRRAAERGYSSPPPRRALVGWIAYSTHQVCEFQRVATAFGLRLWTRLLTAAGVCVK